MGGPGKPAGKLPRHSRTGRTGGPVPLDPSASPQGRKGRRIPPSLMHKLRHSFPYAFPSQLERAQAREEEEEREGRRRSVNLNKKRNNTANCRYGVWNMYSTEHESDTTGM